jgi:hypothetical protein
MGCGKFMKTQFLTMSLGVLLVLTTLITDLPAMAKNTSGGVQEGLPSRRSGGGRRGFQEAAFLGPSLTALVPENEVGLTLTPKPTLYFYIPPLEAAQSFEFVVRDEQDNLFYATFLNPVSQSGILTLDLAELLNFPDLQANQNYHWYFSLIPDRDNRAEDTVVEGWIQHVTPSSKLQQQLKDDSSLEALSLYQSHGLWYDLLGRIVELRQANPQDVALHDRWVQALESVGLENIAPAPLLSIKPTEQLFANIQVTAP